MVADGRCFQFLRFIKDGKIGGKLFRPVNFEQEIERLQIFSFEEGVLRIGLIRQQFEEGHEMFLDVVHDFCLFVADVECAGGSISGRGKIGIGAFFTWGVYVAGALVEDDFPFSAHELQHENEQEYFGIDFSVFSLDDPP